MGGLGKTVHVLPDSERVEAALCDAAAERRFVDASGFLTFSQFIERFEPAAHLGRRPISPLAARVLVNAVANGLPKGPFGDFIHEPAFARAALELFFDLKAGALPPLGFKSAVQTLHPGRQPRARYLAELYAAYDKALGRLEVADREDLTAAALAILRKGELPASFADVRRIELKGLYDFPPLRRELLVALSLACERAKVQLAIELPGGGGEPVDAAVDELFREFEKRAQETTHTQLHKTDLIAAGRPLAPLGPHLFGAADTAVPVDPSVLRIQSAANERQEQRLIAHAVREAVRAGTPPERIAIAYRDLAEEAEALEEVLEEAGVRARVRRGAPLTSTAAGRAALDLPRLVDDGFPAEAVALLLGGRYVPGLGTGHDDATAVARVLAEASVRDDRIGREGARGAYDIRLSAFADRLAERKRGWRADDVRTVRERCVQLITLCSRIPEEAPASELLERWWSVVKALGIMDATRVPEPRADEASLYGRSVLRMLARDQAAAEALRALATEFAEALKKTGAGKTRITRRTFQRWLHDAAADFNLAPRGPRGGAVRILDLRELPARAFDTVCIGGATDGRLPGRAIPHPLLPDEDRAQVNRHQRREVFRLSSGEHDGRAPWRLAEDRLLFFSGLAAATRNVLVSWAREDAGREQLASPFVDELSRRTKVAPLHEPLSPVPKLDVVATEAQLRERLAIEILAPESMRVSAPERGLRHLHDDFSRESWFAEAAALSSIEEERLRFFSTEGVAPGPYSGGISDPELNALIAQIFAWDKDRPVAATTLERFGNCAFQGFLSYVLRLEEPEAPGEEQDRKGQGAFWHAVLERLFPRLRDEKLLNKPVDEIPDALLDDALEVAAQKSERRDHTGHPTLWRLSRERARAMCRRILGSEHGGLPFESYEPLHTELQFGKPDAPEPFREIVIPAGDGELPVYLEGKIDRLDQAPGRLGIVDYKSSLTGKNAKAVLTTEFQLPIYLYAAQQSGLAKSVRAAWISLKDAETKELAGLVGGAQGVDELLQTNPELRAAAKELGTPNLANAVHELAGGLRAGRFPARPQDCGFCAFKAACRITDRRVDEDGPAGAGTVRR